MVMVSDLKRQTQERQGEGSVVLPEQRSLLAQKSDCAPRRTGQGLSLIPSEEELEVYQNSTSYKNCACVKYREH